MPTYQSKWIKVEDQLPVQGNYITKNQYSQQNMSFFDGEQWTHCHVLKGSCMLYADGKVCFWKDDYGHNK